MELDHYTTQFLTGHGDFNDKLASFNLVGCGLCRCREERETVVRMLFKCALLDDDRDRLRARVCPNGEEWPCNVREFVVTKAKYKALRRFAKEAIRKKREYTHANELRRMTRT